MLNRGQDMTLRLPALRALIPVAISLAILWLLRDRIMGVDVAALSAAFSQFQPGLWVSAAGLSIVSFYAIAQYDRLAAHMLDLKISRHAALMSGWRATAVSQVLGYGLITGALIRWWALGHNKALSLWACARLTLTVTGSFFAGWVVVTAFAVLVARPDTFSAAAVPLAWLIVIATSVVLILSLSPQSKLQRVLPNLSLSAPIIFYTFIDTLVASAVIYLFLPAGYFDFFTFYTAFLIALAVGMTSGLPGGLGAFELCLIALLGMGQTSELLSAILAYRVVYFAGPAVLAMLSLIAQRQQDKARDLQTARHRIIPHWLQCAVPPEAQLLAQDQLDLQLSKTLEGGILSHQARHCDLILGDPFSATPAHKRSIANQYAATALRPFCFYKCSQTLADWARAKGFIDLKIGSEAYVNTHDFNLSGSEKRQLRRKLSRAEKSGLEVAPFFGFPDQLAEIDQAWQARNGPARRFSMGSFDAQLLAVSRVWVASLGETPVAFISVMTSADKWTLDLIRMTDDCPDGTIHALVVAAIHAAKDESIAEFSLASVPFHMCHGADSLNGWVARQIFARSGGLKGLHQFKASFAPSWRSEYFVANGIWAGCIGAVDIFRTIHGRAAIRKDIHNHYWFYEIASKINPCHALLRMTQRDRIYGRVEQTSRKPRLAFGRRSNRD
ncbi:MAG: phosphatidylglycerol lysyltransferase domain-containing protein [Pseudomonadota bacterium]